MFKLDLEKIEEPEIKLSMSVGLEKNKRIPEKQLLLYWLCQSLCVDHNKLWKILQEMGISDSTWTASWEICMQIKKQQLEREIVMFVCVCVYTYAAAAEYIAAYCHVFI